MAHHLYSYLFLTAGEQMTLL